MKINLDKNKKYILGCSSGPDSMCLFSLLLKENINFVVANIDYNYREGSIEETELVRNYCKQNNIYFYTKSVQYSTIFHNFEAWAREIRYDFFNELGEKLNIENILIAHNQDDLIETYLMQKERKSLVSFYGLNRVHKYKKVNIIRPLLDFKKEELLNYCKENYIPYIIDPTNSDTNYRRNYFRHNIVRKLSKEEREEIIEEINQKNFELQIKIKKLNNLIHLNTFIYKDDFIDLDLNDSKLLLSLLINANKFIFEISDGLINDLKNAINKKARSYQINVNENLVLTFDYDRISLLRKKLTYCFNFNNVNQKNEFFQININNELIKELVSKGNILIKPAINAKRAKICKVFKSINRVFIDYKLPKYLRNIYPGLFDENNNLIYLPRYRENFKVNEKNVMTFNLEKLLIYLVENENNDVN